LFLAGELALAGVSTLVVEARAELTSAGTTAIRGLNALTLRTLQLRGLKEPMVDGAWAAFQKRDERATAQSDGLSAQAAGATLDLITGMWPKGVMKGHFARPDHRGPAQGVEE
jgi:hypothetical protein